MKEFEQYGRIKERRRKEKREDMNEKEKETEKEPKGFFSRFNNANQSERVNG